MGPIFILLLAVATIIPSSISQCTTETALPFFKRSVYEFSIDLVKRIASENENHFISSALSPYTLISALSLGAADDTLDEIKQVLRLHHHKCFNSKLFEIIEQLTSTNDRTVLSRSSVIYADDRLAINDLFKSRIQQTKVSDFQQLSFYNTNEVASLINGYVSDATRGNIEDIVEPSDLDGVLLILIDALYFKGTWQNQFSVEDTEISSFYDERNNQIGDVNLMFGEIGANYSVVSQIGATVLELPYGDGRFSMLFILPDEGKAISSVLDDLKRISLSTIFILFGQTGPQPVMVQIPRFKIVSDLDNMKEWLADMGLRSMFDSNSASFPDISDSMLYVSNFIQKASIEVTEEGTEASAASAGFLAGRSLVMTSAQFTANRPFLYMIVDRQLELALFTGAYSKPSVY